MSTVAPRHRGFPMHRLARIAVASTAVGLPALLGMAAVPVTASASGEAALTGTPPTAPRPPQAPEDGPRVSVDPPLPVERPESPVPAVDDGKPAPAELPAVPPEVTQLLPETPGSTTTSPPAAPSRPPSAATATARPAASAGGTRNPFPGLPPTAHAAYSTGTVLHTDTVEAGGTRLRDVNVGFSSAAWGSQARPERLDEFASLVAPAGPDNGAFARGRPVALRADSAGSAAANTVLSRESRAQAPPAAPVTTGDPSGVELDPLLVADLLHSQAQADSPDQGCLLGTDLASAAGSVAGLGLVDLAPGNGAGGVTAPLVSLGAGGPDRRTSQSVSLTRLVPPARPGGPVGLASENRQTLAPVSFLTGTDRQFTVEVLGEWALRAVADGRQGAVTFGPAGGAAPETPVVRITGRTGDVLEEVTLARLLGERGLVVDVGEFAEITLGEDPRAIGGDATTAATQTPTLAAGAADILRVRLVDTPDYRIGDFRLGHMEAAAAVPAAGILCPGLGVTHKAEPATVKPGDRFTWTITVTNPNDCTLDGVKLVDTLVAAPGVRYSTGATNPAAEAKGGRVTWADIGPLGPGASRDVTLEVEVAGDSKGGRFTPEAVATGMCSAGLPGSALIGALEEATPGVGSLTKIVAPLRKLLTTAAAVPFAMEGRGGVRDPEVVVAAAAPKSPAPGGLTGMLARTGGMFGVLPALILISAGALLRRFRRPPKSV